MASSLETQASMDGSEICFDDRLPPDLFKWVIDMDAAANKVDISEEEAAWKKPSIYRVTPFTRSHNPNAYTPKVVSFGPFHNGSQLLKGTELAKDRALAHFLNRAEKGSEPFVSKLQSILKELQDSYQGLDKEWKENPYEFLKMMLLDGCFMIEVLRMNGCSDDYAPHDPVFSSRMMPLLYPFIKRDMLLLENQLPLLVLKALLDVENRGRTDEEYINSLVLSYCARNLKVNLRRLANHPLELYRIGLVPKEYRIAPINKINVYGRRLIENAVELGESGVRFRANYDCMSMINIKFDPTTGRLNLPPLPVDDGTEHLFLNMIAYEQIHVDAGNEITSYVMFMDALINTEDDVKLLVKKNIIINSLGSHKDIAYLFNNRLAMEGAAHPNDSLNIVRFQLSEYYVKRINRATIWYQYYLHNPGKVLSVVVLSLLLTLVQTVCSVLSVFRQK